MKIICHLFLAIGCAALMPETGYAAPSNAASQQTSPERVASPVSEHPQDAGQAAPAQGGTRQKGGNPSDGRGDNPQVSVKNHPRSPVTTMKARPKQLSNNREHSPSGNTMSVHQPGSDKSGSTAKTGLIQHKTANTAVPRRPPSAIRASMPLLNNVRHRAANPAVIGGSANSTRRNAGTINGTSVHRRP